MNKIKFDRQLWKQHPPGPSDLSVAWDRHELQYQQSSPVIHGVINPNIPFHDI